MTLLNELFSYYHIFIFYIHFDYDDVIRYNCLIANCKLYDFTLIDVLSGTLCIYEGNELINIFIVWILGIYVCTIVF